MSQNKTLVQFQDITKTFPGVRALKDLSFAVPQGKIVGLLGENGAGKSTLIKILSGAQSATSGKIFWKGQELRHDGPQSAQQLGIVTIYQEFNLVGTLSVAENIFLGRQPKTKGGILDWGAMNSAADVLMRRIGLSIRPETIVSRLSIAQQQMVEIARALSMQAQLIIMDEPTATLSQSETAQLIAIMTALRGEGVTIIFVTHRLEEVMQVCDEIVVLRDGALVATRVRPDFSIDSIIDLMVGRQGIDLYRRAPHPAQAGTREVVLSVRGLSTRRTNPLEQKTTLKGIDFDLFRGEILGLAGLVGAGRTELVRAIFGADPITSGTVSVAGRQVSIKSPADAIRHGIALVPEDRKQQGLFLTHSTRTNFSIASLQSYLKARIFIDRKREAAAFLRLSGALNVKMTGPDQRVGLLSGGNQQKIILARWMALNPSILIVDEPTRGIDIGAKSEVHQLLRTLADRGMGVVVISSDLTEVLAVSDRILTITEGHLSGECRGDDATEEFLMARMAPLERNKKTATAKGVAT